MTKEVTYVCDVCGHRSEKPYKLHLVANLGSKSGPDTTLYADVCSEPCAVKFAKQASDKAGIVSASDTVTVAS